MVLGSELNLGTLVYCTTRPDEAPVQNACRLRRITSISLGKRDFEPIIEVKFEVFEGEKAVLSQGYRPHAVVLVAKNQ